MSQKEVLFLVGEPNANLYSRYFPDNPISPRICHLEALLCVGKGLLVPEEIQKAVLNLSIRERSRVEETIDTWNKAVRVGSNLNEIMQIALLQAISISYGTGIDPKPRSLLIESALITINNQRSRS